MNLPHISRPFAIVVVAAMMLTSGCASFPWHRSKATPPPPAAFAPAAAVAELPPIDASLLQRPTTPYRLGPGDQLDIEVLGDIDTRSTATVGPDGKIYFYLLPGIDVWGLTIPQTRDRIVDGLQQFVREKQPVSVTLRSAASQRVWILGRLNKPGVYPLTGPTTLLEAIAEAGGLSARVSATSLAGPVSFANLSSAADSDEAADLSRAFVMRQGNLIRVDFRRLLREGDLSQNIYLQPDDFIYLPAGTNGTVHVLGAVYSPRAVDVSGQLTLVRAVAEAGGSIKDAYLSHVAIVRGSLSQPRVAVVDFGAIQRGQAPDVALEQDDIVYVPFTPYRVLNRYVDMILLTFARTMGVNEGARAVSRTATPVGVNVPIGVQ